MAPLGGLAKNGEVRDYSTDWYVIQALSGKFVVYQRPTHSSLGTIQIADRLADLEQLLPANLLAEVARAVSPPLAAAGYRELPLEGA